jgi:RsiW-degrading membrane proteinase PrsW (M82 family)
MDAETAGTALSSAGFVAAGSVFWLKYFLLKDALQPEPKKRLAQAFALGACSVAIAWGGFQAATALGMPASPPEETGALAVYCLAVVGPVEEGAKFLVARAVCFRWKEFDERIDGLVYAAAVALGFAAVENFLFLPAMPWGEGLLRAIASPLTHSLFAAIWGLGSSRALLVPRSRLSRFLWQAVPLVLAMTLHGLYDIAAMNPDATLWSAVISAALWALVIWKAGRLVRARPGAPAASADPR